MIVLFSNVFGRRTVLASVDLSVCPGLAQQLSYCLLERFGLGGSEIDFDRQIERRRFQLIGEIRVVGQTHGVFLGGDNDAVVAFEIVVAPCYVFDVFAVEEVVVGEYVDFHYSAEAFEVADERSRISDSGHRKNTVGFREPVEIGYRARHIGEHGFQMLIGEAREVKMLVGV